MSRYNIIDRLKALKKHQADVIAELSVRKLNVSVGEFSQFVRGLNGHQPKCISILEAADKIITEWEEVARVNHQ